MEQKHLIEFKNVSKSFSGNMVLDNVNLYINKKEFLTILGPSGCGKTTMLRILAGFEEQSGGEIDFNGAPLNSIPNYKRRINTVFQNYALFPHLNVFDNVAFGLKLKKLPKETIKEKVVSMLNLVNLAGFEKRKVDRLSGGQQQRVAIARALVNEPEVLLLDEPLGALDLKLRKEMQLELKNMQQTLGITFVFVTHDQEEALTMSDTIMVMNKGKIQQIGTPIDIYNEPNNAFVADFIGESNILTGIMKLDKLVNFCGLDFECLDFGFEPNEEVDVVIRPEDFKLSQDMGQETNAQLKGEVLSEIFKGVHYEMTMKVGEFIFTAHNTKQFVPGQKVNIYLEPDDLHIMKKVRES